MNHETVLKRMNAVFQDVFDDDGLQISDSTSAKEIPEWDSLMHITVCIALEHEFGVKLNAIKVASLTNAGELAKLLLASSGEAEQ